MSKSSTVCVDANIVVRLVLFADDAIQGIWETWTSEEAQLVAPTLLRYEVANSLHQYQKHGLMQPETLRRALETALALPLTLYGDADLHRSALRLAETYRLPAAYDAHYLALAECLGAELWTTDARLVHALQAFHVSWVRLAGV